MKYPKFYLFIFLSVNIFLISSCNNDVRFTDTIANKNIGSNLDVRITNSDQIVLSGKCDSRSKFVSVTGAEEKTIDCKPNNSGNKPVGQFSFKTNKYTNDEKRTFTFSQTIEEERISSSLHWYRDTVPPQVVQVFTDTPEIGRPVASVKAVIKDNMDFLKTSQHIQIQEADLSSKECQSRYNENSWTTYSGASKNYGALVSFFTGKKKLCVWAKDYAGNISIINSAGKDQNQSTEVFLNVGQNPAFSSVSVVNTDLNEISFTAEKNDNIKINFEVTDKEGLAAGPISIFYTLNGEEWLPLVKNYGSSPEGAKKFKGSYNFPAPTNTFFRVMLVAKDKASNTSYETLSQPFNAGRWSVYAGNNNRGVGQSALSLSLQRSGMASNAFAIHPQSLDIYAIDQKSGLLQIDAHTGLTKVLIKNGQSFLPENGPLTADHRILSNYTSIKFPQSHQGELYISTSVKTPGASINSQAIYILNTLTNTVRKVAGGGLENDSGASPANLYLMAGNFTFDESDNIYIHTTCTPGLWDRNDVPEYRLLKLHRQPSGTYNQVERIAGGCSKDNSGKIKFGSAAYNNHYNKYQYAKTLTDIAVWENGKNIYVSSHGGSKTFKILNGIIYPVENPKLTGGLLYSSRHKKLYIANGGITEVTPHLDGPGGETYKTSVAQQEGAGCTADGALATATCVISSMNTGLSLTPGGYLFFGDGMNVNRPGYYRVRILAPNQKVYTMAGHLPFYGNRQDKSVIRSGFAGIHYKAKTAPNQQAFPEGLYFVDKEAAIFGHIDPKKNIATILAGNQSRLSGVKNIHN